MLRHNKLLIVLIILALMLGGCAKSSVNPTDQVHKDSKVNEDTEDITESEDQPETDVIDDDISDDSTDTQSTSDEISVEDKDSTQDVSTDTKPTQTVKSKSQVTGGNDSEDIKIKESSKESTEEKTDSTDEISEEDIKFADKVKAFKLAAKRLSGDQISELMDMAKGGFTADEKARAKELFYKNFTDEEREWILNMYEKYY